MLHVLRRIQLRPTSRRKISGNQTGAKTNGASLKGAAHLLFEDIIRSATGDPPERGKDIVAHILLGLNAAVGFHRERSTTSTTIIEQPRVQP